MLQRLEMLDRHEPGKLSEVLKDALREGDEGKEPGSWIWTGMSRWGYPPGYYAVRGTLPS